MKINKTYTLRKLDKAAETIPFDLLLMADETTEAIRKYIYHSDIYLLSTDQHTGPIAVAALYKITEQSVEIKNIGVMEAFRSNGIGSFLIGKIKEIAKVAGYREILVGTPDTGIKEIQFYKRNGFKKYEVKKNFYLNNYTEAIFDNGIQLKDMVILKVEIN